MYASDTEASFFINIYLLLTAMFPSKFMILISEMPLILIKRIFPLSCGDVSLRASYEGMGVLSQLSQLIRFARVCSYVTCFNARNKCIAAKLLTQSYRYHKFLKAFFFEI